MSALILLVAALVQGPRLIATEAASKVGYDRTPEVRGFPSRNFLFGYWFYNGGSGRETLPSPFAIVNGKEIPLPVDKWKFGHAYCGDTRAVYGDVSNDEEDLPCRWTPDTVQGWSMPVLAIVDHRRGRVLAVDKQGRLCINSASKWRVLEGDSTISEFSKDFGLGGIDAKGHWFGTTYSWLGPHAVPSGKKAVMWDGKNWFSLNPDGYEQSTIVQVNDKGIAVGAALRGVWEAVVWEDGRMRTVLRPLRGYAEVRAVNDAGDVAGIGSTDQKYRAWLLTRRGKEDISDLVTGVDFLSPQVLDPDGDLAAVGSTKTGWGIYVISRTKA